MTQVSDNDSSLIRLFVIPNCMHVYFVLLKELTKMLTELSCVIIATSPTQNEKCKGQQTWTLAWQTSKR